MFDKYRVVAVTPAGRQRYLEILLRYLLREHKAQLLDEWVLWLNTTNARDLEYCQELERQYNFVRTVSGEAEWDGNWSIHYFFRKCVSSDTIYVRFDDDVVFLELGALEKLISFRIENPDYFLIFPNIINNSVCSHIHQRLGQIPLGSGICKYEVLDEVGWRQPETARQIHMNFLRKVKEHSLQDYKFGRWILYFHERFSINSLAFFGKQFAEFDGIIGRDEEVWLSEEKPRDSGWYNCVCGESLVSHFAYHTQRDSLEASTDLLQQYKILSLSLPV